MVCPQNLFNMNFFNFNPFGFGMTTSPMIFDMLSTNSFNMQNLRYNYLFADIQARSFSGLMPSIFGGGFFPYSTGVGMFQTLTPPKNVEELARSCGALGGGFGMLTPFTPSAQGGNNNGSSSGSSITGERIKVLKELLNQIKTDNKDNTEISGKISEAIKKSDDAKETVDKYEILKDAYKELDKDLVKESLTNLTVADGKKLSDLFKESGYSTEFSANSDITNLRDAIEGISKKGNPIIAQSCILGSMNENLDWGASQILDVISRWNNTVKDENGAVRNIFDYIQEKGASCDDVQDLIDETVSPLVNSLTKKAEAVIKEGKKCLSKAELDSLKKYSSDLANITSSTKEAEDTDFSEIKEAFNKLYVALRFASVKIINKKINDKFGFLEDETLKDLYKAETEKDLKEEGLGEYLTVTSANNENGQTGNSESALGSETGLGASNTGVSGTERTQQQKKAYIDGGNVRYWLNKNTSAEDAQSVDNALKNINKNNVLDFLSGYHDEINGRRGIETIIEKMDDDNTENKITMENKKKFIKAIIDKAKDMGIDENTDKNLSKIVKTVSLYEKGGRYANRKDFKRCRTPFWIWTGFARNDDEYLGRHIYKLYKTMKNLQNEQ